MIDNAMRDNENRTCTCCFTGHRPEKLQGPEEMVIEKLDAAIQDAIRSGYRIFISGMAKGVDIWAAELVLRYRETNPQIQLICAVPYQGFGQRWGREWWSRFLNIIQSADAVHYICPSSSYGAYQARNIWMVDRSSLVISVYNGSKGGTRNTIAYAKKQAACTVRNLNLNEEGAETDCRS